VAERRNFLDALEPFIYLNSSFVIACWDDRDPFHLECQAFLNRLKAEEIVCVVSDFTYNEVAFFILRPSVDSGSPPNGAKVGGGLAHQPPHLSGSDG
jgi:predicted nucleic acid-binding protein